MQDSLNQTDMKLVSKLIPREDGKIICKELKKMRKALADANGIDYEITECYAQGACAGTCPACDIELLKLKQELEKIPMRKRVYPEFIITKTSEIAVENVGVKESHRPAMGSVHGFMKIPDALKNTSLFGGKEDDEPEIDGDINSPGMGSIDMPWNNEDEFPFT